MSGPPCGLAPRTFRAVTRRASHETRSDKRGPPTTNAEIRSLAVRPETSGRGVGKALVDACVARARQLGLRRVFALTLVPEFFERCGFTLISLGRIPEKSAAECPVCPKRFACDEQAMLVHLDGSRPEPLRPGEPWGYTRIFLGREPERA